MRCTCVGHCHGGPATCWDCECAVNADVIRDKSNELLEDLHRVGYGFVDVATDDRGARLRQERGRSLADAASDSGEHCHPVGEIEKILYATH